MHMLHAAESSVPKHRATHTAVLVDANNVRGRTPARALDEFCTLVWRWWRITGDTDSAVLLCIDHGSRESSMRVADGFERLDASLDNLDDKCYWHCQQFFDNP